MKEGKFEKIKKEKKDDDIRAYIDERSKFIPGDLDSASLKMVKMDHLLPEVKELFRLFMAGAFEVAQAKIEEVNEKIAKITEEKEKNSNEAFVQSFDHLIEKRVEESQTGEFNAQDNT